MNTCLPLVYRTYFLPCFRTMLASLVLLTGFGTIVRAATDPPVQAPAVLTVSVSSATVCAGTSATLTAAGCPTGGSIRWSTTQVGATVVVAPGQTTTYTAICEVTSTSVTTTTATSSSATSTTGIVTTVTTTSATGTVQVYPPIKLSPVVSLSVLCNGGQDGQIAINASGGTGTLQYQFNGQPFQTLNNTFGNLKAGTYTVGVKDALGCIAQANVELKQPPSLSVTVTTVSPRCIGGSDGGFIAVASGGVGDYRYLLNSGPPQESGTFINLNAGVVYSLIVVDKNGCLLFKDVTLAAPTPFSIKLTPTPARCAGSSDGIVSVSVTGGSGTYRYQIGSGPLQTGTQFTGLAANSYEVTVLDGNGCQGKQTVVVGQPAPLQLTAAAGPVNCFGANSGSIRVTPTGGTVPVKYQLTTGGTAQSNPVFAGIGVGDYTVVGTDANGCTSLTTVTVGKADPLKIMATSIAASCCVCPTGAFSLSSTGGTGTVRQYQVIGQPYQASPTINGLRPNTYRLRVADEVGCTDSTVAVVTDGAALTLSVANLKNVSCEGGRDGEATVQVAGGKKPFTYYWATERRDTLKPFVATQASLLEGTYTVSVVDSNRCSSTTLFVPIKAQFPLPYKPSITQVGSSTLLADQSAGVQWYIRQGNDPGKPVPNATNPALVPVQSGQYYAVITTNGCSSPPSDPINFILTALPEPMASLSVRVVPNPIVDRLRLEIEQVDRSAVTVQLLDVSGRAVMTGLIPAFTGKKQAEWPLNDIAAGRYLLKVNADTRQSTIRVLVE